MRWVFDRPPASGSVSGGDPAAYAFEADEETFVRETLQNSHDQLTGGKVRVTYAFHSLSGAAKEAFTTAMGWDQLKPHVEAAAKAPYLAAGRYERALQMLQGDNLLLLKVVDSGTRGLVGGEDDHEANFAALCLDVLVTTRDKAEKGGSHGLGKAVLAVSSQLTTVLFSSTINVGGAQRFRLFGKSELPHHKTVDDRVWRGPGWFGSEQTTDLGQRAESVWDAEAELLAAPLLLTRGPELGTGTSILVVGFHEHGQDDTRDPKEIAGDLLAASTKYFWPAIARGSLEVSTSVHVNGELVFSKTAELDKEDDEFFRAASEPVSGGKVRAPGEIAERTIPLRVPARKKTAMSDAAPEQTGTVSLRIIRAPDDSRSEEVNRIALVRGAGMVVQYWKPKRFPIGGEGFFGVLLAGKYLEDADNAEAVETFLRAAEPPAHNRWTATTHQIASCYSPGTKARLEELEDMMTQKVVEMCSTDVPDAQQGPALLARLFPLARQPGAPPPPPAQKFQVTFQSHELRPDGWHVAGTVMPKRGGEPWRARLSFRLDGESGSEPLPIKELELLDPECGTASIEKGAATIQGWVGAAGVQFRAVAARSDGDSTTLRRTRLGVEVRPLISKEAAGAG
ncbi:MAG: hypothetical protein ACYDHU_09745 [Acidimicrobiales bacterium]